MGQPKHTEEFNSNPIVLSDWRVDGNGVLLAGVLYAAGTVLGKITSSGKYTICASAAGDGSEVPCAVLLDDVDATASDLNGPLLLGGKVDKELLTIGTGHTLDEVEDALRDKNIYYGTKG